MPAPTLSGAIGTFLAIGITVGVMFVESNRNTDPHVQACLESLQVFENTRDLISDRGRLRPLHTPSADPREVTRLYKQQAIAVDSLCSTSLVGYQLGQNDAERVGKASLIAQLARSEK